MTSLDILNSDSVLRNTVMSFYKQADIQNTVLAFISRAKNKKRELMKEMVLNQLFGNIAFFFNSLFAGTCSVLSAK